MIKLIPNKIYEIPYVDPDDAEIAFSVSWQFPLGTSTEMYELRKKYPDPESRLDKILVDCIKAQTGFIDEEGILLDVTKWENRAAIYDFIKPITEYRLLVLSAQIGPRAKNLLAGPTPPSTGNGDQKDVSDASKS